MRRIVSLAIVLLLTIQLCAQDRTSLLPGKAVKKMVVLETTSKNEGNEIIYEYDSCSRFLRSFSKKYGGEYIAGNDQIKPMVSHNEDGSIDTTFFFNPFGEGTYPGVVTQYDSDHDPVSQIHYNFNGEPNYSTHYIYGADGKLAVTIDYLYGISNRVVTKRIVTSYNKHGDRKERFSYTPDDLIESHQKYSYDRYGNKTKVIAKSYEDGRLVQTDKEQYKYTYDSFGNWTSLTYFMNGRKFYTTTRTITYW